MLTEQAITNIYEATDSISKISELFEVEESKVLLIRIGELFGNTTKDLLPGLHYRRTKANKRFKLEKSEVQFILNSDYNHDHVAELLGISLRTVIAIRIGTTRKSEVRTKCFKTRNYHSKPHCKLTQEMVIDILEKLKTMRVCQIAAMYGLSKQTISAIKCGTRWPKVPRSDCNQADNPN